MKSLRKLTAVLALVCVLTSCFAGCGGNSQPTTPTTAPQLEAVDYAAQLKLEMSTNSKKQEVTVKTFIDGDTVHFNVPTDVMETGVLKARFLAINTPESTGKIEEYGKKASSFTRERLEKATSIIVESDDHNWNVDSTGERHLVWVWYKTEGSADYRNLNLEILQEGLAIGNSASNNRYGSYCANAINQAKTLKLHVHSGKPDPDFYYGQAIELDLKELRTNTEAYSGLKVAFTGVITKNNNNSVYVEAYDAESDMYYGMSVYYGFNLTGTGLDVLAVGNESRIVGTVQYYEAGGTWQVSGLTHSAVRKDPDNIEKLSSGHSPSYRLTDPATFANGKVELTIGEEKKSFDYAQLAMSTSVSMKDLLVVDIYTTSNEDSSSKGAMTLTCQAPDGTKVDIRTVVLLDENGKLITSEAYLGKTIDVTGIVDYYSLSGYQIKVFSKNDITVH